MHALISALSFASALTAIFAFRFSPTRRTLVIYFVVFGSIEFAVHTAFLPEGAVPIEAAMVLFGIAAIFVPLTYARRRWDAAADAPRATDTSTTSEE